MLKRSKKNDFDSQCDLPELKKRQPDSPDCVQDESYFRCYENIFVHEEMLEDQVRTMAYRQAILRNYEAIHGKVVLDVGAGTGILSMFCVHAGARKVYAIEASQIAVQAQLLVERNNMSDRINVIHAKIEEVELPEKVDVIVSEWMGYFMLYESMLPSVLIARDKWLKKGGLMLPSTATLHMSAYSCPEQYNERLGFWDDASSWYKVDLTALKPYAWQCISQRPQICEVVPEQVFSHAIPVCQLDLNTVSVMDINQCKTEFSLQCFGHGQVTGFAVWFDVEFPKDVKLSTSPYSQITHWTQSVLLMSEPQPVEQDTVIKGIINIKQNKSNTRFLDIDVDYTMNNHSGKINCIMDEKISFLKDFGILEPANEVVVDTSDTSHTTDEIPSGGEAVPDDDEAVPDAEAVPDDEGAPGTTEFIVQQPTADSAMAPVTDPASGLAHRCAECNKEFSSKGNLHRHQKSHTGDMLTCVACNKHFPSKSSLEEHCDRTHRNIKYICDECGKIYHTKHGLKLHAREHAGIFTYMCSTCGKGFNYKTTFQHHMALHDGIKPHKCNKCTKTFTHVSHLRCHERICRQPRNTVTCDACGKCFKSARYLSVHMRDIHLHPGRYQCAHCAKPFNHRASLNKHSPTCNSDG